MIQRLQTLFGFATFTARAAVATGDTDALLPKDVILRASHQESLCVLIETFLEAIVRAWLAVSDVEMQDIKLSSRTATESMQHSFLRERRLLFQSFAAPALSTEATTKPDSLLDRNTKNVLDTGTSKDHDDAMTAPTDTHSNEADASSMHEVRPTNGSTSFMPASQPTSTITLVHTPTESSVPACLWRKLASKNNMDSLLITEPAEVLLLPIQHTSVSSPFSIDMTVHLDPFLWEKRRGERVDGDASAKQAEALEQELAILDAKRTLYCESNQGPMLSLLQQAEMHLTNVAKSDALAQWLRRVREALEHRIQST